MNSYARWIVFTLCNAPVFLSPLLASNVESHWLDRKAEGWAWYEDRQIAKLEDVSLQEPSTPTPPLERLEQVQEALETKRALAVLEPTEQHIREYMEAQLRWQENSALFAEVWQKILLSHPELDPTVVGRPVVNGHGGSTQ